MYRLARFAELAAICLFVLLFTGQAQSSSTICPTSADATCYYPYIPVWADSTSVAYNSYDTVWYYVNSAPPYDTCSRSGGYGFDGNFQLDGNGAVGTTGIRVGPFNSSGSHTFYVSCPANPNGNTNSVTINVAQPSIPNPTASISSDTNNPPFEGKSGTTLHWSSSYATSCSVTSSPSQGGSWSGTSGSVTTPSNISSGNYTYTARCNGQNGTSVSASTTVRIDSVWANQYNSEWAYSYTDQLEDTTGRVVQSSSLNDRFTNSSSALTTATLGTPSTAGCRTVTFRVSKRDLFHVITVWRFQQLKHWCWAQSTVGNVSVSSQFTNLDGLNSVVNYDNGIGANYFFTWNGRSSGGHKSERHGSISNCIFKWGCLGTSYPTVTINSYGDGTWTGTGKAG